MNRHNYRSTFRIRTELKRGLFSSRCNTWLAYRVRLELIIPTSFLQAVNFISMSQSVEATIGQSLNKTELEEMFKSRYTEEDVKYMDTVNKPLASPPCVRNWYSRPKRSYDFARGQGSRSSEGGDRGHWRDDWSRDRSRDRGYSNYGHRDQGQRYGHRHQDGRETSGRVFYPGVIQSGYDKSKT